jgi:putative tryptophan/tyrosine transport system substrate-binding protein
VGTRRRVLGLLGGAFAWPVAGRAQPSSTSYRIGYLALLPGEDITLAKPILERLRELGFVGGRDLIWTYRSAEGAPERLPALAVELLQAGAQVLVAGFGTLAAQAAKAATATTPIVFTSVGDPVGAGLVASLGRPGGNVTGLTSQAGDIAAKRLQILIDLLPEPRTIAVLLNPDTPFTALAMHEVRAAAEARQRPLTVLEANSADQVASRLATAIQSGVDSLLTLDDPLLVSLRHRIIEVAAAAKMPAIYGSRSFVEAGGLMSYGVDRRQMSRHAAEYVAKILKGARAAELPVEQPTAFEFIVNLRAAEALGLIIPSALLARADEVIE